MKKMKWIPLVLLIPALFLIVGCPNPTDPGDIPTPTNVTIIATANEVGVRITWDQVTDIDGYDVITPDGDTIDWLNDDQNTYDDVSPASTGTYEIYCVLDGTRGNAATVSSAPYVSTSNVTLDGWGQTDPSGFGWTTSTGIGQEYTVVGDTYKAVMDFYFYDEGAFFDFASADESPYEGDKNTGIINVGASDFGTAPSTGYSTLEHITGGDYYAFYVEGEYYAKVHVVSTTATSVTFNYEFQKIQTLRLF